MRNLVLIVHISLDGFVAGPEGELDGFDASDENLQFVCSLTEGADAALMGGISYKLLNDWWPTVATRMGATTAEIDYSNWYNAAQKIVISKTLPGEQLYNTVIIRSNIEEEISKLKEQPGKNILIFGSPSVTRGLMQADLIDSYWIFINPVIFGKGIKLFAESSKMLKLTLVSSKAFSNGEFGLHYVSHA
jgi:dihydrofolate reductase